MNSYEYVLVISAENKKAFSELERLWAEYEYSAADEANRKYCDKSNEIVDGAERELYQAINEKLPLDDELYVYADSKGEAKTKILGVIASVPGWDVTEDGSFVATKDGWEIGGDVFVS